MTLKNKRKRKFILFLLLIFLIYALNIADFKKIISYNIIPEQNSYHTTKYKNMYFYFNKDDEKSGIYKMDENKNSQLVYEVDSIDSIAANEENIFISSNNKIIKIDYNGKEIITNNSYDEIGSFYLYKEYLYISSANHIYALDINDLSEVNIKNNIYDTIDCDNRDFNIYINENNILTDNNYYSNIRAKNSLNSLVSYNRLYNCKILLYYDDAVYYNDICSSDIYKYKNNESEKNVFESTLDLRVRPHNIVNYGNKMFIIQQEYEKKGILLFCVVIPRIIYLIALQKVPFRETECLYESEMCLHSKDSLIIVDKDTWKELDRIETKSGERIIFADENIFMTYYKNYITKYNINDCSVIEKKKMKHIGKSGNYYFELCKDKIFVYNNEFKVIDIIDIN